MQQWLQELRKRRELENLRQGMLYHSVQEEGMARQAAATLIGSQAGALMKELLTAWRQLLQELRKERRLEQLQEEERRHRAQKKDVAKQALALLLGEEDNTLAKNILTVWRQLLRQFKKQRDVGSLHCHGEECGRVAFKPDRQRERTPTSSPML